MPVRALGFRNTALKQDRAAGLKNVARVLSSIVPTRILGVIPARFASSRFPGKALAKIAGKTMLQHVFERSSQARYLTHLVIATDDERIRDEARRFGAPVRMTRSDHLSGTDRVAEVASAMRIRPGRQHPGRRAPDRPRRDRLGSPFCAWTIPRMPMGDTQEAHRGRRRISRIRTW